MHTLNELSDEICRGCLCKILSKEKEIQLTQMCHGHSFLIGYDGIMISKCPCEKCLVKSMCQTVCVDYKDYKKLARLNGIEIDPPQ